MFDYVSANVYITAIQQLSIQVTILNTNNLHTVIWFQVFLSTSNNLHTCNFKYSCLLQIIFTQLFSFKYSYLTQIIFTQLYVNTVNLREIIWSLVTNEVHNHFKHLNTSCDIISFSIRGCTHICSCKRVYMCTYAYIGIAYMFLYVYAKANTTIWVCTDLGSVYMYVHGCVYV